jgi:hypothetical protein
MHLLLKTGSLGRSIVMGHHPGPDQRQDAQQSLHKTLPAFNDRRILQF